MASQLDLRVLTPADTLLEVEGIKWVHLRLVDGTGISVYPGHARLLAETVTAPLRYADADGDHAFGAEAGIVQVDDRAVTVYTSGSPESKEAVEPSAVSQERQFKRLARALQERLEREPSDLLGRDAEQR